MSLLTIVIFILGYALALVFYNLLAAGKLDSVLTKTDLPEKTIGTIEMVIYALSHLVLPLVVFLFIFQLSWWQAGLATLGLVGPCAR